MTTGFDSCSDATMASVFEAIRSLEANQEALDIAVRRKLQDLYVLEKNMNTMHEDAMMQIGLIREIMARIRHVFDA